MNARGDAMIKSTCASDSEAYGQYCSVMKISSEEAGHLLPYAVTLASKLALGFAAATILHMHPASLASPIPSVQHGDVTVPAEDWQGLKARAIPQE